MAVGESVANSTLWDTRRPPGGNTALPSMGDLLGGSHRLMGTKWRQKLKVVMRQLTGHTTLTAHMFQLGLTQQQGCQLCSDKKEDSVHFVFHCLTLECNRYRTLGCMF